MSAGVPLQSAAARGLRLGRAALQPDAPQALLQALLELRGAAVKLAQFLSLEHDLLSPAAAAALAAAQHRVPPIGPELARHRVQVALGPIEQHFAHFEAAPFAAASLGQVHAATGHDGTALAVKIQYPGIERSVRSDLALLRRSSRLLRQWSLPPAMLDELQARLLEECDYHQEAQAQAWFAARLRVDGLLVAAPRPALSGRQVLTTERLPGLHLDDWLRSAPPQAARDRAAQALFDAFVQSLRGLGRLHGDPNPGNLLFQPDGRVALLDFGCTRWLPAPLAERVVDLLRAAVQGDDTAARAACNGLGLADAPPQAEALLRPFREWVARPLRAARFDFGADPGFVTEGRRRFVQLWQDRALAGLRPELVLVHRTLYGLYRVFDRLGARVACQAAWAG